MSGGFDPKVARFLLDTQLSGIDDISTPERLYEVARRGLLGALPKAGDPGGLRYVYRGQTDARWGIRSSLHRIMKADTGLGEVWEPHMMRAETEIIASMKKQGLGRGMTWLQLITVLQHHGIPTRLIDVSLNGPEALFFATDRDDSTPGRLFILGTNRASVTTVDPAQAPDDALPWGNYSVGRQRAKKEWTNQVHLIEGAIYDARMLAQRGAFCTADCRRLTPERLRTRCEAKAW